MSKKRAQAAMEFMLTYGWAILVVLVVIAGLSYFGVLSPSALLPDKCNFQVGLSCVDYSVSSQGMPITLGAKTQYLQTTPPTIFSVNFDVINNLGDDIYITKVNLSGQDFTCMQLQYGDCSESGQSFVENSLNSQSINPYYSCLSIKELCAWSEDNNFGICTRASAQSQVLWKNGEKFKSHLGYDSQYLSILCYAPVGGVPKKGTKMKADITIEYSKSPPGSSALTRVANGNFFITVS
ncbi:MAG: hypothetical protein KKE20_05085 [Nanoarchaeota archaeon]|nr:hypothetical protein [Nanoarchaeota archaeon]